MQRRIARLLIKLFGFSLAALLLVPVFTMARQIAKDSQGLGNLKRIGIATQFYAGKHDGYLPPLENVQAARLALAPFLEKIDEDVWQIPGISEAYFLPNATLSKKQLSKIKKPEEIVLFYEPYDPAWRGKRGVRVVYVDGHARNISSEVWPHLAAQCGIPPYQTLKQPWDLYMIEAIFSVNLELLVVSTMLGAASLITQKR